jgi:DNA repair exonuclease SbcCD nuclease subunit
MFKFLHTADIHLDSPLRGLESYEDAPVEQIRQATRRAFDNLIELAIDQEVAFVLIAGDLYDGDWKDYNTGLFFINKMSQLRAKGIKAFVISGNHDAASQITRSLHLPDNVHLLSNKKPETISLEELGVAIHGQGYSNRAITENIANQYPARLPDYLNIGLLHTALTGRENHEPYAPCSIDDLKSKGYDYWALGHIHKAEVVSCEPWIVFPGNPQGRHIKEQGTKGAALVTVDNGRIASVDSVSLDVLRWQNLNINISEYETIEKVHAQVQLSLDILQADADNRPLAVRLQLTGKSPLHGQLIEQTPELTDYYRSMAAGLGEIWLEKVLFQTERPMDLNDSLGDDTPIAELIDTISNLELSHTGCLELAPELEALKNKLPTELLRDNDPFHQKSSDQTDRLYAEVKEIFLARLLRQGRGQ